MFNATRYTSTHLTTSSTTRRMARGLLVAPLLLLGGAQLLSGCQDVSEPKIVLTQAQWKEVEKHILKEEPSPQHKLNVNYGNEIELIGFDVEPAELEAGKQATFTWYWKALETPSKNWEVFIHFDAKDKPLRQGLDHHPVDGLFKTSLWKKGQIVKDVQTVTLREDFPTTEAIPYIGLYNGQGINARLMIVNNAEKTDDRRAIGPTLKVKGGKGAAAKAANQDKPQAPPVYSPSKWTAEQAKALALDGKIDEELWGSVPTIKLEPFGKGQNQATWAKIAYTEEALYVAAHLEDAHIWGDLKERDSSTWKEEVFELFLDTNRDAKDYLELQVTPNNVIFDANFKTRLGTGEGSTKDQIKAASSWNYEGLVSAVHVDGTINDVEKEDKSWSVEIKLPFAALPGAEGKAPADGTSWALNMYRFDRPTKEQSFAYAWSRLTRGTFHDVPKFGVLRFGSSIDPSTLMRLRQQGDRSKGSTLGVPLKLAPGQKQQLKLDPRTLRRKMPTPTPMQIKPQKTLEKK